MHLDHIQPLAWGGPDTEDNLQVAHERCNCAKGGRLKGPKARALSVIESIIVRFVLRIPNDLHQELKSWAEEDQRSLHGQILWLLRRALKEWRQAD